MQKWVYIVESNCKDPSREDEFVQWYNDTYLPERLSDPGFMAASFFQNTHPRKGEGKFVAVYRIESDEIEKTFAIRAQRAQVRVAAGRTSVLIELVARSLYQEVPCPP